MLRWLLRCSGSLALCDAAACSSAAAKLEELARAKIDEITRALDTELWRLWPEERRQHEKNIVAMIRMASPKRGDFMVDGNAGAFSYWAQVAGPNDLLSTLPLERDGDKRLTTLSIDGSDDVLEWNEAETTSDTYPRYAEMFDDGALDIAIHVGGDHCTPRNDIDESQAIYDELVALGMRSDVKNTDIITSVNYGSGLVRAESVRAYFTRCSTRRARAGFRARGTPC